jgi:hypothetical protein
MVRALSESLRSARIPDSDKAGVALARRYAFLLDEQRGTVLEAETYDRLGPKLLAALTALGLTAAGRGLKGGVTGVGAVAAALDEFTARRRARLDAP